MINILIKAVIFLIAIFATDWLLPGIAFKSIGTGFSVAILLAGINIFVKPILRLLTLEMTLLTLGVFPLILNTAIVLFVAYSVEGFAIFAQTFIFKLFWAFMFSVVLSAVNVLLEKFTKLDDIKFY